MFIYIYSCLFILLKRYIIAYLTKFSLLKILAIITQDATWLAMGKYLSTCLIIFFLISESQDPYCLTDN